MPEENKKSHWPILLIVLAALCLLGVLVYINGPPTGFKRLAATADMRKAVKLAPTLGIEANGCEESDGTYSAEYSKRRMLCTWVMWTNSIDCVGMGRLDPNATEIYLLIMHKYRIRMR